MARPALEFNRLWSVPSGDVPDDTLIAAVLERPTPNDMRTICLHYGCDRVDDVLRELVQADEIGKYARQISGRMVADCRRPEYSPPQAGLKRHP